MELKKYKIFKPKNDESLAHKRGKDFERRIAELLTDHGIVFRQNITFIEKSGNSLFEVDFIVPGGIIECKVARRLMSINNPSDKFRQSKMRQQVLRFEKYIPPDLNIYIFSNDPSMKKHNYGRVYYIHCVNDILLIKKQQYYSYFVTDALVLRSLVSKKKQR